MEQQFIQDVIDRKKVESSITEVDEAMLGRQIVALNEQCVNDYSDLTPTQHLYSSVEFFQKIEALADEDQAERENDETFQSAQQEKQRSGIDKDSERLKEAMGLLKAGHLQTYLEDASLPDYAKAQLLQGLFLIFQHGSNRKDIAVAARIALMGSTFFTEDDYQSIKEDDSSVTETFEELKYFNLTRALDRLVIYSQQERLQTSNENFYQIFGTQNFVGEDSHNHPQASIIERAFYNDPEYVVELFLKYY